jgi:D-3-phosphoglycerate dehydrogenase / 2-oxoglutarate reductase
MKPRILVTPRSLTRDGHPALERLVEAGYDVVTSTPGIQPNEEELATVLKGCVGYLAGVEPITGKVLEAAPALRVISRNGTGIDNIDQKATTKRNIRICRAIGANARGVAELTIGLILALARSIPFSDAQLKKRAWERRKGFEIEGKTLGLIGCGKIGSMVANMSHALGMIPVAYDPYLSNIGGHITVPRSMALNELFPIADVISLHCPSQPGKQPIIDADALAKMKQGVFLINTARADLIDETAVLEGLESGQVAGLAVDVYREEPPMNLQLVSHSRVIATPHIGGFTNESVDRATCEAVDNLLEALEL